MLSGSVLIKNMTDAEILRGEKAMIKLIKTDAEYRQALVEVEALIDSDPPVGTAEGDQLELLAFLISDYEEKRFPIELPDPIEAIKFRMEQKGLTQRDLIPYIGSRSKVSEILSGKRPLSLRMIRALNKELGIPAEVLLQESGAIIPEDNSGIDWLRFPIGEMVRRSWFPNFHGTVDEARDRAEELLRSFFRFTNMENPLSVAYRQNVRKGSEMDMYALLAWQVKVLTIARDRPVPVPYKRNTVTFSFLRDLAQLSYFDDGPRLAREFLAKSGIHVVTLRHLPKTHLDGAAMLLSDGTPVIALTIRYDRLDNFWFCLCHELAHVALHLSEASPEDWFIDDLNAEGSQIEEETDKLARDALIPPESWQENRPNPTTQAVSAFANQLKIHPAIVAGRIQWEQKNYRILNRMVGRGGVKVHFPEWTAD